MPVQTATSTRSLIEEKPAAPLQPFSLPPGEADPLAAGQEDAPVAGSSGPKLPAVFPVYAWI